MIKLQGGSLEELKAAARADPDGEAVSYREDGHHVELWYFEAGEEVPQDEYRYVVCTPEGTYIGCFEPGIAQYFT